METGDLKGALVDLDWTIKAAPADAASWYFRAAVKGRLKDMDGAFKDVNQALQLSPTMIEIEPVR